MSARARGVKGVFSPGTIMNNDLFIVVSANPVMLMLMR